MSLPTKTPLRNVHMRALASVNDQLCLTLFMHEDVAARWQELATLRPTEFTSEVFPDNEFAERIHVPMTRLLSFRDAQLNTSLGVSFAFAVEQLLLFIEAALRHWGDMAETPITLADPIDETLNQHLVTHTVPIESSLLRTVKYLRLRRNHVIHGATELSSEYSKLLKHDAPSLQRFWEARSSNPGMIFGDKSPTTFSPSETITLVKLVRICLEEIDTSVAGQLRPNWIFRSINAGLLKDRHELRVRNPVLVGRRIRKIKHLSGSMYGLHVQASDIASALGESLQ
ncbi:MULTISPECIES: hypothetical protein [unclassified Pseudomonas]|uniref:hypothetical protein n=1 Tax=unclassified Pseudomonas TaxID=196821 RepID=UPI000CD0103B|nr:MULTISPECIES: hypothetical protein [unclassified Pseudomonas]POA14653.1 hypothetical protein C1892_09810 [Pseudomonas sp. MPBD7-1]